MEEHLRARQAFADEDWDLAQFVLQSAGEHRLLKSEVRDSLHPAGASSVAATYVRLLLLHMVGARSLGVREFETARELAHFFDAKSELSYAVADGHGAAAGAPQADSEDTVRVIQTGELVHFLDVAALSNSLRARHDSLAQGKMFDKPALANPPAPPALKSLLSKLRTAWCSASDQRQAPRSRSNDEIYAAFEPVAIYALMKRRNYIEPPPAKVYDHTVVSNIYLRNTDWLPGAQRSGQPAHSQETWNQVKPLFEVWHAHDRSATGMRLTRVSGGEPMRQGQLMALRLGDAGSAMVAVVRWAVETKNRDAAAQGADDDAGPVVEIGVQMLPGLARAGAVRFIGVRAVTQKTAGKPGATPVLILDDFTRSAPRTEGAGGRPAAASLAERAARPLAADELPELILDDDEAAGPATTGGAPRYSSAASILVPAGWANEGEVVEFVDGAVTVKLRVGRPIERYGEIERVAFQAVE
jgi:hypothetical protein